MSYAKVLIIGNLGKDPELKYSQQGTPICTFSVATSEKWRDKSSGEMQERTTWFRVVTYGKQAENCSQWLTKGKPVYVEGRLKLDEWNDREGNKRTTLEVNANEVQFLGSADGKKTDRSYDQRRPNTDDHDQRAHAAPADSLPNPMDGPKNDIPF